MYAWVLCWWEVKRGCIVAPLDLLVCARWLMEGGDGFWIKGGAETVG